MADEAFQIQFRKEAIMGFEFGVSDLRTCVTTEVEIKGNQAVFLVADSGGVSAVNRGVNGLIPARSDDLQQFTATLVEWHDLVRRTSFNLFASQGNGNMIMQKTTRKVMNRKIDTDIISALSLATNATATMGAGNVMNLATATKALTILGVNAVPTEEEDNLFFLASPAARAYLLQTPEFTKGGCYVDIKPLVGPSRRFYRWAGFNWIFSPLIPNIATNNETCFAFHRDAIGHAVNTAEMQAMAGYQEEQDYSWARTTAFMGSQLLQNKGVVLVPHDGSAYAAV
jgi:hypothetical protein